MRRSLVGAGLDCHIVEIPDGEDHKTLATVAALYERFAALGLDRSAAIVALGGGVTGDVAGFAAATYLRGLPFVQVPTTLLAMVDASVGGKTGVDLPTGKNLVGAFYQPRGVVCDVATLATCPKRSCAAAWPRPLKTALLGDGPLFEVMESTALAGTGWPLAEIVERCVRVKARVVEADPQERGLRAILNLGHTIGHGVEQASGYRYRHGEAVSIGLVGAVRLAVALGLCEPAAGRPDPERLWLASACRSGTKGSSPPRSWRPCSPTRNGCTAGCAGCCPFDQARWRSPTRCRRSWCGVVAGLAVENVPARAARGS